MQPLSLIQSGGVDLVRSSIILTLVTASALILRLTAKRMTKAGLGVDDALLIFAQVLWYGQMAPQIYVSLRGSHIQSLADPQLVTYMKAIFVVGELYFPMVFFTNTSILLFYRRTFPVQDFARLVYITIFLHILWFISSFLVQTFMCKPISVFWNDLPNLGTKCIDYSVFFVISSSVELALDVILLALPISRVVRLRLSWQSRSMVAGIFMLGGVSIVTGIVRIIKCYIPGQFPDLTQDLFWTGIHVATALICACLPTYRPLVRAGTEIVGSVANST